MDNENAIQIPTYSADNIFRVFADLNIKVTDKDLKKPSVILVSFFICFFSLNLNLYY